MRKQRVTSQPVLQWLTVCGPASYLTVLALGVLYLHPHPLPPFWPAFVVLLMLSSVGTFAFSHFVFVHVQRQEEEIVRRTRELADVNDGGRQGAPASTRSSPTASSGCSSSKRPSG